MAESIQVVQPHFLPDADEQQAAAEFWDSIASDPLAVVLVEPVFAEDELDLADVCSVAVFSCYERALDHAKALRCHGAIIVPKRVDEPSWGNVEVN